MPQNKLFLRNTPVPYPAYPDVNLGKVLTHTQMDGNFIYLKGNTIVDANVSGSTMIFNKINGETIEVSGITDFYVTGATTSGGTITLTRNDGEEITITGITSSGKVGITDDNGQFTYYTSLSEAMSAATGGQTIFLFSNLIELNPVSIVLKDGVNIEGNGFFYYLATNSDVRAIIDNGVAVTCNIHNLTVIRDGSYASNTNNEVLVLTNSSTYVDATGSRFQSNSTLSRISGRLVGGYYRGNSKTGASFIGIIVNGTGYLSRAYIDCPDSLPFTNLSNLYVEGKADFCTVINHGARGILTANSGSLDNMVCYEDVVNSQAAIHINSSGNITNCTAISTSLAFYNQGGTVYNCIGISSGDIGYRADSNSTNYGCIGKSSANRGLYIVSGIGYDCKGYSSASIGATISEGYNCLGYSTASLGISSFTTEKLYGCTAVSTSSVAAANGVIWENCTFISKWNDVNAHGVSVEYGNPDIINCHFLLVNSSAYGIYHNAPRTIKFAKNTLKGSLLLAHPNITQGITTTEDNQGNLIIN